MPAVHTHGMLRECGATTVVAGQNFFFVGGKLWAVQGDPNTHGNGGLIPTFSGFNIGGKKVIVHAADDALPDNRCPDEGGEHCSPATAEGSDFFFAY